MGVKLALAEGIGLAAAVYGTLLAAPRLAGGSGTGPVALTVWTLAAVLSTVTAFYYTDFYDLRTVWNVRELGRRFPRSLLLAAPPLVFVHAAFPHWRVPPWHLVASLGVGALLLLVIRTAAYLLVTIRPQRLVLVGANSLASRLAEEIAARPHLGWTVLGVVDDEVEDSPAAPLRRLGPLAELDRIIREERPERVIVTLSTQRKRLPLQALLKSRVQGILVEDGVEVYERLTGKLAVENLTSTTIIFSKDFRLSQLHLTLARWMSLAGAALSLLVLTPLLSLIGLAIALDSRGPVFFVQERVGLSGRPFKLLKFRTMHPAHVNTSEWVRDNEHRITRIGRWLRRFRLDELPQLLNVLQGHMNLVGPRPHPFSNWALFVVVMRNAPESGESIPYYSLRCAVRPGITGWAQVRYRYANDLEEETEKMRYDLFYIKHASVWLDLRILLDTVKVVLVGHPASSSAVRGPRVVSLDSGVRRPRRTSSVPLEGGRVVGRDERWAKVRHPTAS
jgi:exopolysaccharide biosynthesis polyprenyl glycosylphosphotransferase